jgi:hypothetical protein
MGTYTLIESPAITWSFHYSQFRSIYSSVFCNKKLYSEKLIPFTTLSH